MTESTHSPPRSRIIIHVVLRLDVGGLERMVVQLARKNRQAGDQPRILCIESRGSLADAIEAEGVPVRSLEKPPGRHPQLIDSVEAFLKQERAQIVHTHQIGAAWYAATAAKRLNLPVIHTEHGNVFARTSGWLNRWKIRLLLWKTAKQIDCFGCISEEIAQAVTQFPGVARAKVQVFPNGIDLQSPPTEAELESLRSRWGLNPDDLVLGTVGRLHEVKRQDWLLDVMAALKDRFANLKLLLVGDGPERANLEARTKALGLEDRVRFTGYTSDPMPLLFLMHLFCLPSRSEGFPVSLLEAWNARLPVVCSRVGGIPQIVDDQRTGQLFNPQDQAELIQTIEGLLNSPSRRHALGEAGFRELQSNYSLDQIVQRYSDHYDQLLHRFQERVK